MSTFPSCQRCVQKETLCRSARFESRQKREQATPAWVLEQPSRCSFPQFWRKVSPKGAPLLRLPRSLQAEPGCQRGRGPWPQTEAVLGLALGTGSLTVTPHRWPLHLSPRPVPCPPDSHTVLGHGRECQPALPGWEPDSRGRSGVPPPTILFARPARVWVCAAGPQGCLQTASLSGFLPPALAWPQGPLQPRAK